MICCSCTAAGGVGEMFIFEGRINGQQYINVLETAFLETALMPLLSRTFGDANLLALSSNKTMLVVIRTYMLL